MSPKRNLQKLLVSTRNDEEAFRIGGKRRA